jgi:hypothetical protein
MTRTGSYHEYDNEYEADNDNIMALIRLPPMTTTNVTGEGGRVPGGARLGPPFARKQQRLPPLYVDIPPTSPCARVVSVTSSMTLMEWRIVSTSDDEADDDDGVRGERRAYRPCPFPRRRGGSLDLSAPLPPTRSATTPPATTPSRDIADWTSLSPPSSWRTARRCSLQCASPGTMTTTSTGPPRVRTSRRSVWWGTVHCGRGVA